MWGDLWLRRLHRDSWKFCQSLFSAPQALFGFWSVINMSGSVNVHSYLLNVESLTFVIYTWCLCHRCSDSECLPSSGVTPCESDLHLSGFQVPTEAGRPYKFASSTSLFTPLVAWATRACLFATCPSYCRPCWTSCLIKVSSARSYYTCSTQLWKQTNIQHHSLCWCGIIFILNCILCSSKPVFCCQACNIVLWP